MFGNRHFVIVVTRENRLRLKFLRREHGLLHDPEEKKSYAVVADAYPTNWPGKWARAYLVHEEHAQTATVEGEDRAEGRTTTVAPPLAMVAKKVLPGVRGEAGKETEVVLTAESIFDRTMSVQTRRLGNRRIQWFHAILFVSLGIAIALALVAAIMMFSGGGGAPPAASLPPVAGEAGVEIG